MVIGRVNGIPRLLRIYFAYLKNNRAVFWNTENNETDLPDMMLWTGNLAVFPIQLPCCFNYNQCSHTVLKKKTAYVLMKPFREAVRAYCSA
ncbi:hypothetical protein AZE31_08765 [Paenibacillus polymyxa]|nr:hypothetical protein AZE31_08765 [Paenibacillus polymyxa]